ncbi:MAG: ATP phosphoribosyltransferase regulatory subunit [Shimia sp.]
MPDARTLEAELLERFQALGAARVTPGILQPADQLLDLYGEDIRARAYVTTDAARGEMMLRPDFTVPVVQAHMAARAEPARYCYAGLIFRQQPDRDGPAEYPQVGYEVFDRSAPEAVEAELFATFHDALAPAALTPVIGDIGILLSAVRALPTSDLRRETLLRHVWRPARFRALLDRYATEPAPLPEATEAPEIGIRSASDVSARRAALAADARTPPLDPAARAALEALLAIAAPAPEALAALDDLIPALPGIAPGVARLAARLEALEGHGIDPATLRFEVGHGRTSMEYYDGFTFTFARPGARPIATGGRYDALTAQLGQGRSVPAVGGVIRPDLLADLLGGVV